MVIYICVGISITANGQVYEPCGMTYGQSNEAHGNNFKIFFRDGFKN